MMDTRYYCWSINRSGQKKEPMPNGIVIRNFTPSSTPFSRREKTGPKTVRVTYPVTRTVTSGLQTGQTSPVRSCALFLQQRHKKHGDNDRNYMALITGKVNVIEAKPYGGGGNRLGSSHCPCIQQIRMDHDHTDHGSQKRIAAEKPLPH